MNKLILSFAPNYKIAIGILITFWFLLGENLNAQQVTGVVTESSTQEPLPGVNISIQGTTTGTSTNADGALTRKRCCWNIERLHI